ncbi:Astacin-like metalloendopeptidase [Strongyloides ratti]|uniref:Metalloendopeptidase n=1 Tax=Strongyloides ratti TaxID=34506 RepID=A0A090LNF9_STRRB|nr:Astacin-like metalloendopeptidase [Strongyloides ratti]CEF71405.1 Astacin-like metalloendopeptidase [Strongyloides ratti]
MLHILSFTYYIFYIFLLLKYTNGKALKKDLYFDKTIPDHETILNDSDFINARVLRDSIESGDNIDEVIDDSAMYNKNRFEGDIINNGLTARSIKSFMGEQNFNKTFGVMRNAVRQTYLKWSDGRIPYTISSQYSSFSRSKIAEAIEEYRKLTCIDFAPKSAADVDYIHIVPDDGCYSLVGRVGGKQPVSLGDGCIQKGIIIHELMHSVGFFHEQSRSDRDEYINIKWENVEAGLQDQFEKYDLKMIDHLDTKYDYGSVMHYASTAFSKNGKITIEPRKKGVEIGQRVGFSPLDLYKINKLYNCPQLVKPPTDEISEEVIETTTTKLKKTSKKPIKQEVEVDSNEEEEIDNSVIEEDKENIENGDEYNKRFSSKKGSISGGDSEVNIGSSIVDIESGEDDNRHNESNERMLKLSKLKIKFCKDKRRDCKFLAENNHCQIKISKKFMKDNCPKSCGLCKKIKEPIDYEEDNNCKDSRSWCGKWADSGMCQQAMFREYMKEKCPKSCDFC